MVLARAVLLFLALTWGAALSAQAGQSDDSESQKSSPGASVLLLPGRGFSAEQQRVVEIKLLDQAFQHSGRDRSWLLTALSRFGPSRGVNARLSGLEQDVKKGKKEYRYMKFEQAQKTFGYAAAWFGARPVPRCNPKTMADMYFYWGRSVLDGGDQDRAQDLLSQIPRFDSESGPDPAVMPPNLVAAFDVALEVRKEKIRNKVIVESGPATGTVYVDCQLQAAGRNEIDLVVGDSLLLAADITGGEFSNSFSVSDGPAQYLRIFSSPAAERDLLAKKMASLERTPLKLAALKGKSNPELDVWARSLGSRVLILGELVQAVGGRYVRLALYGPGKGLLSRPVDVPLAKDSQPDARLLKDGLVKLAKRVPTSTALALVAPDNSSGGSGASDPVSLAPQEPLDDPGQVEPATETREEDEGVAALTPWYETWWFWTAAGVVLVGAVGAGVGLGLAGGDSGPSGDVVLSINRPQ